MGHGIKSIDLDGVHLIDSQFNAVHMQYKSQADIAQHERQKAMKAKQD